MKFALTIRSATKLFLTFALLSTIAWGPVAAHAATAVTAAAATFVDSDGDGVPDLTDNAPGASNPGQNDLDADQIGDAIDPLPTTVGPFININFALTGSYTVAPGDGVTINYTTGTAPVGDFGHIIIDLQPGELGDAYAFQSLATPGGSFFIPANLITIPGFWDLNTPGTYSVEAWAFGPGVNEGYKGGAVSVTVVPEPASFMLLGVGAFTALFLPRFFLACGRRNLAACSE